MWHNGRLITWTVARESNERPHWTEMRRRFEETKMAKECRCMKTFKSWEYIGPIPHRSGKENHMWECQICHRKHVTADKQKPSEAQANRVLK